MSMIELDLYKEVTVIIRYEDGSESKEQHSLENALQLWHDASSGMTGMTSVRIFYEVQKGGA